MKTREKPRLIALVRSRPEEAALQVCKMMSLAVDGPNTAVVFCFVANPEGSCPFSECSAYVQS